MGASIRRKHKQGAWKAKARGLYSGRKCARPTQAAPSNCNFDGRPPLEVFGVSRAPIGPCRAPDFDSFHFSRIPNIRVYPAPLRKRQCSVKRESKTRENELLLYFTLLNPRRWRSNLCSAGPSRMVYSEGYYEHCVCTASMCKKRDIDIYIRHETKSTLLSI